MRLQISHLKGEEVGVCSGPVSRGFAGVGGRRSPRLAGGVVSGGNECWGGE